MRTRDCKDKSRVCTEPQVATEVELFKLRERYSDCDANPSCSSEIHKTISRLLARIDHEITLNSTGKVSHAKSEYVR